MHKNWSWHVENEFQNQPADKNPVKCICFCWHGTGSAKTHSILQTDLSSVESPKRV